jgi:hypothetical protein
MGNIGTGELIIALLVWSCSSERGGYPTLLEGLGHFLKIFKSEPL